MAQEIMFKNLDIYEKKMSQAKKQKNAQIIVFPEDGLYGAEFPNRKAIFPYLEEIPNIKPGNKPIPLCNEEQHKKTPVLSSAACKAKQYDIYMVVNMGDLQWCNQTQEQSISSLSTFCPYDGRFQFNTQVALSNQGELLAKYHKTHLFPADEACFNYPPQDSHHLVYFDTDFGVRFGMFICFDIFFQFPSEALRTKYGIDNFVFSTYWENDGTVPLITASQMQQAWSRANNANLLASNIGFGLEDSGSGIYSSGNIINTVFNPLNNTARETLLLGRLPKHVSSSSSSGFHSPLTHRPAIHPLRVPPSADIQRFQSDQSHTMLTASSGKVECSFNYSIGSSPKPPETFALIAYDGTWFGGRLTGKTCGLIRCPRGDCSRVLDLSTETVWTGATLTMRGDFMVDSDWNVLPVLGQNNGQLIDRDATEFTSVNEKNQDSVQLNLISPVTLTNMVLFAQPPSSWK